MRIWSHRHGSRRSLQLGAKGMAGGYPKAKREEQKRSRNKQQAEVRITRE